MSPRLDRDEDVLVRGNHMMACFDGSDFAFVWSSSDAFYFLVMLAGSVGGAFLAF